MYLTYSQVIKNCTKDYLSIKPDLLLTQVIAFIRCRLYFIYNTFRSYNRTWQHFSNRKKIINAVIIYIKTPGITHFVYKQIQKRIFIAISDTHFQTNGELTNKLPKNFPKLLLSYHESVRMEPTLRHVVVAMLPQLNRECRLS